jgi:ferredoxin-NADP reductase
VAFPFAHFISGITPIASMLEKACYLQRNTEFRDRKNIYFAHAVHSGDTHAYTKDVKRLEVEFPHVKTKILYDHPRKVDVQVNLCLKLDF